MLGTTASGKQPKIRELPVASCCALFLFGVRPHVRNLVPPLGILDDRQRDTCLVRSRSVRSPLHCHRSSRVCSGGEAWQRRGRRAHAGNRRAIPLGVAAVSRSPVILLREFFGPTHHRAHAVLLSLCYYVPRNAFYHRLETFLVYLLKCHQKIN